eukprot:gb/GEZN01000850.1/.p1 GENE.gb/GEZN01000850.1/~~gb/GEZN01000850.1/.p1  ORF type:complete len:1062 (-),score=216.41 gb/GEZN01000850.1/:341-3526(-)
MADNNEAENPAGEGAASAPVRRPIPPRGNSRAPPPRFNVGGAAATPSASAENSPLPSSTSEDNMATPKRAPPPRRVLPPPRVASSQSSSNSSPAPTLPSSAPSLSNQPPTSSENNRPGPPVRQVSQTRMPPPQRLSPSRSGRSLEDALEKSEHSSPGHSPHSNPPPRQDHSEPASTDEGNTPPMRAVSMMALSSAAAPSIPSSQPPSLPAVRSLIRAQSSTSATNAPPLPSFAPPLPSVPPLPTIAPPSLPKAAPPQAVTEEEKPEAEDDRPETPHSAVKHLSVEEVEDPTATITFSDSTHSIQAAEEHEEQLEHEDHKDQSVVTSHPVLPESPMPPSPSRSSPSTSPSTSTPSRPLPPRGRSKLPSSKTTGTGKISSLKSDLNLNNLLAMGGPPGSRRKTPDTEDEEVAQEETPQKLVHVKKPKMAARRKKAGAKDFSKKDAISSDIQVETVTVPGADQLKTSTSSSSFETSSSFQSSPSFSSSSSFSSPPPRLPKSAFRQDREEIPQHELAPVDLAKQVEELKDEVARLHKKTREFLSKQQRKLKKHKDGRRGGKWVGGTQVAGAQGGGDASKPGSRRGSVKEGAVAAPGGAAPRDSSGSSTRDLLGASLRDLNATVASGFEELSPFLTSHKIIHAGWVMKEVSVGLSRTFKRRYQVLYRERLVLVEKPNSTQSKTEILLEDLNITRLLPADPTKKSKSGEPNCTCPYLELKSTNNKFKPYRFYPELPEEERVWHSGIFIRIELFRYLNTCKENREPKDKRIMKFLDYVKDGYSDFVTAEFEPSATLVLAGQPLGEHGLEMLKLILENPLMGTVYKLEMPNCSLSARDFFVIVSAIGRNQDPEQGLQVLNLSHNLLFPPESSPEHEGAYQPLLNLLSQPNSSLEELHLDDTGLDAHILNNCLRKLGETNETVTARLKFLDLSNNLLGDNGAFALCRLCSNMEQALVSLTLNGCDIADQGAVKIAEEILDVFPALRVLNLVWNDIGNGGAKAIGHVLSQRHTLKALDLSHNDMIKFEGAKELTHMAQRNESLQKLFFLQNRLTQQGLTVMRLIYKYGVPR